MSQYQHQESPNTAVAAAPQKSSEDQEKRRLREQVENQSQQIAELQREMRRLKNELRSAVNAFNLRNHG